MKFELEKSEALEQVQEVQKAQQLETEPPKLERTTDDSEQPPRLGGSVTEMMIEMKKLDIQHMKEQQAIRNGDMDMKEYYEAKKEKLQAEMDEMHRQQTLRRFEVNYGTPTTESGWKEEAAKEYAKWGKETSYYDFCMKEAAKAHVEGK